MTISKVEIERLSVTSSKSFEAVLAALKAAIGRPDMVEFANSIRNAQTFAQFCERRPGLLNLSALKGEDSQATLRITTLTLAPEGSHRPHASGFRRGLTPSQQPFMCFRLQVQLN